MLQICYRYATDMLHLKRYVCISGNRALAYLQSEELGRELELFLQVLIVSVLLCTIQLAPEDNPREEGYLGVEIPRGGEVIVMVKGDCLILLGRFGVNHYLRVFGVPASEVGLLVLHFLRVTPRGSLFLRGGGRWSPLPSLSAPIATTPLLPARSFLDIFPLVRSGVRRCTLLQVDRRSNLFGGHPLGKTESSCNKKYNSTGLVQYVCHICTISIPYLYHICIPSKKRQNKENH